MADHLYKEESEKAIQEGYVPLDLHGRGDICYALKKYDAPDNRHASGLTQDEIKKSVLCSLRMQQAMLEVRRIDKSYPIDFNIAAKTR